MSKKDQSPMSPDVFLSSLGIRYSQSEADMPGTPRDIVSNLQLLRKAVIAGVHAFPGGFVSVPFNPNTWSQIWTEKERNAVNKYYFMLHTGDIAHTHDAADAVNKVREVKGGAEFECAADFDIIAHQGSMVGKTARWLTANKVTFETAAPDTDPVPVLCAFWTDEGAAAIDGYVL